MPFPPRTKQEALVKSKRSCCICNDFAGTFTNVHHIEQEADAGSYGIDNAIVLCLRCHAEVGHYNDRHPLGNKYTKDEVRQHRDNWWAWCSQNPNSPPPKHPLLVTPYEMVIVKDGRVHRCHCKVRNNTDQYYYEVCIQFALDMAEVDIDKIVVIERPSSVQALTHLKPGDFVPVGGSGYNDIGQPAKWGIIYEISPKTEHNFDIEIKYPELLCSESRAFCHVEILHYKNLPSLDISEGNGQIQISWISQGHALNTVELEHKDIAPRAIKEAVGEDSIKVAKRIATEFDVIFAIHTSAWTIRGVKQSVAAMSVLNLASSQLSSQPQQQVVANFNMFGSLIRGSNLAGNQNYRMWRSAIVEHMMINYPDYSSTLRVGLVVDTGQSRIEAINARTEPIVDDYYLPENFTLIYCSLEGDKSNFFSHLLRLCATEANLHVSAMERGEDSDTIYTICEGDENSGN